MDLNMLLDFIYKCNGINRNYQQITNICFIFSGDIIVGKEQTDNDEHWWGFWIMTLMFLPNLLFITWFILARRNKLFNKETWFKVFIAGNVQLVTLIK